MTSLKQDRELLITAAILMLGGLAAALDTTIVNVALGTLAHDLRTSLATIQWVSTGYLLALAMAVPITGWAARRWGAKQVWLTSLTVFGIGSALCGAAWDAGSLIGFRVLQGIGAGLMLPILQTLLVQTAGRERLGRALTFVTLVAVVAPILGPVLGGLLVTGGWRWLFVVNIPLCALGFLLARRHLPASPRSPGAPLDTRGLLLLSPAVAGLVYGLAQVGTHGSFGHPAVLIPVITGGTLLGGFIVHALHRPTPLLDLRLFEIRSFTASTVLMFLSGLSLYGAMVLLPLYFQQVRGQSAAAAGLLLAPQGIGALMTRWAGRLTDRIGGRPVVVGGMALAALGTAAFTQLGPGTSTLLICAALVVRGAGLGAANIAVVATAYQGLPPNQVPDGSSTIRIAQQLGGSFGTAVLVELLQYTGSFGTTFGWILGFTALAFVPALALPRSRESEKNT